MKIGDYQTHPAADVFPLLQGDEFAELCRDIGEHGLREPITRCKTSGGWLLLDGRNRLRACLGAGVAPTWREYTGASPAAFVVSLNLKRRNLTASQKAICAAEMEPIFAAEAKGRQRLSEGPGRKKGVAPVPHLSDTGKARDQAGQRFGVSGRYVQRAKDLCHAAPELAAAVKAGKLDLPLAERASSLDSQLRALVVGRLEDSDDGRAAVSAALKQERMQKLGAIARGNTGLDGRVGKHPVIYADPPWRYEHVKTDSRAIENQYPTMALEEICALPVADITTDDAVLFLWATSPKLAESMRVIESWGFTYRTCMVWDKDRIGMGYYARQQHELLLIATKGSPPAPPPEARPASVYREKRSEHSSKPERFYEFIEAMYPELPKLELFCRTPRSGWSVWGNQSAA